MEIEFWFVNGDEMGTMYQVEGWGRVLVFSGKVDITKPFYFKSGDGETIEHPIEHIKLLQLLLPSGIRS
jgi:hypothetical protein